MAIRKIKGENGRPERWELALTLRRGGQRRTVRRRWNCSDVAREEIERLERTIKAAWAEGDEAFDALFAEADGRVSPDVLSGDSSFQTYVDRWLADQPEGRRIDRKKHVGRLKSFFGDKPLKAFRPKDRYLFRAWMSAQRSDQGKPFSPKTVHEAEICLSAILSHAVDDELIDHNPMRDARAIPAKDRRASGISNVLYADDLGKFLDAAQGLRREWYTAFRLILETGCRSGEVAAFHKDDVDCRRRLVHISKSFDARTRSLKPTKGREERWQRITPALASLLEIQIRRFAFTPILFPSRRGTYRTPNTLAKAMRRTCLAAGVKTISLHGLRHSAATLMAMSDAKEEQIRRFLGHADTQCVRTYVNLAEDMTDESVPEMFSALFDEKPEENGVVIRPKHWAQRTGEKG
jgi:integrase